MFKPIASVAIGQAVVHPLTLEQLLAACDEALVSGRSMVILNVNAHAVVLAEYILLFDRHCAERIGYFAMGWECG